MSTTTPWTDADLALLSAVYDLQCSSRMSAFYYGRRLESLQRDGVVLEVLTAIAASGAFIGALTLPSLWPWNLAWQGMALVAALAALLKPLRAPGRRIERFTRQQLGYHANYFALKKLAFAMRQAGLVTEEHRKTYDSCYDRHVQLNNDDEANLDEEVWREVQELVRKELTPADFWWPPSPIPPQPPQLIDARSTEAIDG